MNHDIKSKWQITNEGGLRLYLERGEEYIEAKVHQGGDNLWTSYVHHYRRGRLKKAGHGRIASTVLDSVYLRPRPKTQAEALEWANHQVMLFAGNLELMPTPCVKEIRNDKSYS